MMPDEATPHSRMPDLRYPIGRFRAGDALAPAERAALIDELASLPGRLREAVRGLPDAALQTPYRPGGWTVTQVVHHLADSHLNSYIRFKLAATADRPTITPYAEERWAELSDAASAPIEWSLTLLDVLHARWVMFLRSLPESDFSRGFVHPESGWNTLDRGVALYAWHGNHHVAHIVSLKQRMGW